MYYNLLKNKPHAVNINRIMTSNIMRNRNEIRLIEELQPLYIIIEESTKNTIYTSIYVCLSKLNTSIYFKDKNIIESFYSEYLINCQELLTNKYTFSFFINMIKTRKIIMRKYLISNQISIKQSQIERQKILMIPFMTSHQIF